MSKTHASRSKQITTHWNGSWTLLTQPAARLFGFSSFPNFNLTSESCGYWTSNSRCIISFTDTSADIDPVEDDLQVAVIDAHVFVSTTVRFENHYQAVAQVADNNDSLKEGVAPITVKFLQHQVTDPHSTQATESVDIASSECTIDMNGLIVSVALIDGAVHVLVPQAFRNTSCTTHTLFWRAILVNSECTTPCNGSSSGHTWQSKFTKRLVAALHAHGLAYRQCSKENHNCSSQVARTNSSRPTFSNLFLVLWAETSTLISWLTSARSWHKQF